MVTSSFNMNFLRSSDNMDISMYSKKGEEGAKTAYNRSCTYIGKGKAKGDREYSSMIVDICFGI